jgi:hypothetical protein
MKTLKKLTHKTRKFLASLKRNKYFRASVLSIPGLSGIALVSLGVSMVYLPAGLITAGIFLLWLDSRL